MGYCMAVISIIVPVYNVEQYLPRCIQSLTQQTIHDIEIILVDDGSTDHSGKICDAYALGDNRIKVIHFSQNHKQGKARNAGLDIATGEYIGFVDADDYVELDTYQTAYQAIKAYKADVSMFAIRVLLEDGSISYTNGLGRISIFDRMQSLRSFLNDENIITDTCVNKLYAKNLFGSIRFQEGILYEDNEITCRLLDKSNLCVHTGTWKYNYLKRKGSTTQRAFQEENLDIIPINQERIRRIGEKYPTLSGLAVKHYLSSLISSLNCLLASDYPSHKESAQLLKQELCKYAVQATPPFRFKKHLQIVLICNFFPLYRILWKFTKLLRK